MATDNLTAEQRLLVACARPDDDDPPDARRVADWKTFRGLARVHAMTSLAYQRLRESEAGAVPLRELHDLRAHYYTNAARTGGLIELVHECLGGLADAGIEGLLHKGPALSVLAYGNAHVRNFTDLDLLVRPRDARRAAAALASSGYSKEHLRGPNDEAALLRFGSHYTLSHEDPTALVELHWRPFATHSWLPLATADVFDGRASLDLDGMSVPTMGLEDTLLVLAIHGAAHGWERLGWVSDIAHLIRRRQEVDWAALAERARGLRVERMLLLALVVCERLLGVRAPLDLGRALAESPVIDELAETVVDRLFAPPEAFMRGRERLRYLTALRDTPFERARFALHRALTPSSQDWRAVSLPPALLGLHYVLRPMRLAAAAAGLVPQG